MKTFDQLKKELLQDPETKIEYDKLAPRYFVISKLIEARIKHGITQKELAEKIGTKQSALARFETGSINPTLDFLERLASAMGYKLRIDLY